MRILIADDNDWVRSAIKNLLSGEGVYDICDEASNAVEAMRLAGELRPELVLLDVSMPGTNGLDL